MVALELVVALRCADLGFDEHHEVGAFDGDIHPTVAGLRQPLLDPGAVGRLPRQRGE